MSRPLSFPNPRAAGPKPRGGAPVATPMPSPGGGLVSQLAPPLRLPGEHFAAALGFWILGACGLVWVAPDIARGAFSETRVVLVTHLFTLGWITTSIQGALYQFLPVALGNPIRSTRAAHLSFALYVPGLTIFLAGLLTQRTDVIVTGAALFATGLLTFVANLGLTLVRVQERNLTWWALVGAATGLLGTVGLGGSLAGNLRWGYLGADRLEALAVHLHVAIFGWVLLVIVGVAVRLLPMFLVSHGVSSRPAGTAIALLAGGGGLLLILHRHLEPTLIVAVAILLGGGLIAFVVQAYLFFRHRMKPVLDPGLRLVGVAVAVMALALLLAPLFLGFGLASPRIATAYVFSLVVGISIFVAGHYYKIVPFLIWFHRYGPLVGKRPIPRVLDLYRARTGNIAAALLTAGALGTLAVTIAGAVALARPVAALYLAGAAIVAFQMFNISRVRVQ